MPIKVTLRKACGLSAIEAENDGLELLNLKMSELGKVERAADNSRCPA